MKKGEIYEGVITDYDFPNKASLKLPKGDGSGDAVKVQKVRFMITKKKSGMAEGRVLELLEKSPLEDGEELCPYFGLCGGCAYQSMSYENQLKLKENTVRKLLKPYLSESENWEGILPAPLRFDYRNKMEFTFGDEYKDGPLSLGLHKKGGHYDILNVSGCKIINPDWGRIIAYTQDFFRERSVPFYHKMKHEGILRNLVVRQSKATGEFLINLVATTQWGKYGFSETVDGNIGSENIGVSSATEKLSGGSGEHIVGKTEADCDRFCNHVITEFADGLLELEKSPDFKGSIAGILYTENDSLGDVVQSDRTYTLYGKDFIVEEILGLRFKISPFSFFQTNSKGCEVLYEKAREYITGNDEKASEDITYENERKVTNCDTNCGANCDTNCGANCDTSFGLDCGTNRENINDMTVNRNLRDKIVFDLYSGTGTIAQMMAPASKKVIGIEIVEEAVCAAKENARLNGLSNCKFIAGDVLKAIDLVEDKPDLIILDPPRDGINPRALEKILAFNVDEMVYISCKPTSLARDLEAITKHGYRVVRACAVDEFPGTVHVETVCLLSRKAQ
jgi:tRNA/tmRNA/rRNA uracil-C5-methylase (TrmA/RlmC/RlmD family)